MKKLLLIAALLLAISATAVACTEGNINDPTGTTVAEEQTTVPDAEEITLPDAEDTTAPDEETTVAPEDTTVAPEETTKKPDETKPPRGDHRGGDHRPRSQCTRSAHYPRGSGRRPGQE